MNINNMNLISGRIITANENRIPQQLLETTTSTIFREIIKKNSSHLLSESDDEAICTLKQWTLLPNQPGALRLFSLIALLAMMVIVVVGGNALVIAAVLMRRRLRTATGLLILSLAVADMLVGLVVLPFSIANEVLNGFWIFGDIWCTAWLTIDIWMCTSSVYNLVAISVDRYIAIIKPLNYNMLITKFRARCIVAFVWISSFVVCTPSFLLASSERKRYIAQQMAAAATTGLGGSTARNAEEFVLLNPDACRCTPSNSGMYYILFSASSSFYIPMAIVIFVYARIYIAAMAATKSQYTGMVQIAENAIKKPAEKYQKSNNESNEGINGSTLKLPRLLGIRAAYTRNRQRLSMDPLKSVPISLNSNSMPTVYAQMNGSCNNLEYYCNNSDLDRRRSEEKLLIKERNNERMSPVRLSIPSEIVYELSQRSSICPKATEESSESNDSTNSSEMAKKNAISNSNGGCCRENPILTQTEVSTEEANDDNSSGQLPESITNTLTTTPLLQQNNSNTMTNGSIPQQEQLSQQKTCASSNCSGSNSTNKRGLASTLLMRILGKGFWMKKKRAGGTYEKRLSLEIKAAKTVAIVTGCFIFCWLGFSIYYGLTAFDVHVNEVIWSIFFWLGYLNSAFNPVIYTLFNREFRTCFKQLLTCNNMIFTSKRDVNNVPMCNSFNSQLRICNDAMTKRQNQKSGGEQSDA
ncbi:G_PROTEIN_RECEP_F1_2 domain-containing protein [Meloidogyne graminicola]|uniref:G_PROTEIN_RECEP_F1_2 domain-containing protein n=1 Tax=Meloidogyne graminicola TaxID=189291 RepID=A0A8T0A287_9BILA|nr:G_PROTEIN_RECEP_F1_2 domain-containing protein [Meloidogyne graminicola]